LSRMNYPCSKPLTGGNTETELMYTAHVGRIFYDDLFAGSPFLNPFGTIS
jgi:hypothetical protein